MKTVAMVNKVGNIFGLLRGLKKLRFIKSAAFFFFNIFFVSIFGVLPKSPGVQIQELVSLSHEQGGRFLENKMPPKSELNWMEKFFKDLMLKESGIYTLWGSKPMTIFGIRPLSSSDENDPFSEEEIETAILLITKGDLQTKWYQELPKKIKDRAVVLENYTYDLHENWEKWKLLRKDVNINKYLLCDRKSVRNCQVKTLVFVNILETARLIQNNYDKFKEIVGCDFDPLSVIFELEEEISDFWDKVLSNSELLGLLCGFGKRNVWCWHWKYRKYSGKTKQFQKTLHSFRSSDFDIRRVDKLSINDFPIPSFVSFFEDDPVVKQYHQEREKIKETYRGGDFVTLTLKKLIED